MKILTLIFVILLLFGRGLSSDIQLELGWKLPKNLINCEKDAPRQQTFTDIFNPYIRVEIEDVYYTIAYSEKKHTITYINTSDFDFKTTNGLKIGDEMELTRNQVNYYAKWEVYGPVGVDGWKPVIGYNRQPKTFFYDSGQYTETEDPLELFKRSDRIKVKILSFSKSR